MACAGSADGRARLADDKPRLVEYPTHRGDSIADTCRGFGIFLHTGAACLAALSTLPTAVLACGTSALVGSLRGAASSLPG